MNESEKIDPRELSPLALAFVGDSVLELWCVSVWWSTTAFPPES